MFTNLDVRTIYLVLAVLSITQALLDTYTIKHEGTKQ